ncbi:unnamed protein product [Porites lobata]|uniref:Uncharacterized protein n=1 Tax=Porites lobata TaxID=104759 RepID=A0ABN8PIM6_9CNID|nr:unnamed protein product [Porites lobata]
MKAKVHLTSCAKNITLRKIAVEKVLQLMNTQLNDICSRKQPSILRDNTKDEIVSSAFEVFLGG